MKYQKEMFIDFSKVFAPATEEQLRKRSGGMGSKFMIKFVERKRGHVAQLKWNRWIITEAHETKGGILSRLAEQWNKEKLFLETDDKKQMALQMAVLALAAVLATNDIRLPEDAPPGIINHVEDEHEDPGPRKDRVTSVSYHR